jgi:hypothetical protein
MLSQLLILAVLLLFILIVIAIYPFDTQSNKKITSPIYELGPSSSGISFTPLRSGIYCPLGIYSSNEVDCNRYFYSLDYIPVGDGPLSDYTAVIEEKVSLPPFFAEDNNTAKAICDSKNYLGFYYTNGQATFFSSLAINKIPLIHQSVNQPTIFVKKDRQNEIIHTQAAFFFFDGNEDEYWREEVKKDKLILKKSQEFIFLPRLPNKVISSFPLIYNRNKIDDINFPPSTAVNDYRLLDLSYNKTGLYVYAKLS